MNNLLKYLLIIATLTLLVATYLHPISAITQDLGRHIKTGEIILNTRSVPKTNLYSYTYPDFLFINHHWGSEVLFYLTYTFSGFIGTLLLTFCCSLIAFLLLYFFALKRGNIIGVSIVSFLSLGILLERVDVRPEAFSFLFLALFLIILFKNRAKPTRWLYTLIPLQLLWTNTHVYFIIGIVVLGLFFLDSFFSTIRPRRPIGHIRPILLLLSVLLACSLITLLNPNGLSGALYPFHVFENYGYQIEENQNIFFLWEYAQKRTIVFFWVSVITLFTILFLRAKHTRPIDWLLTITFTILGAQAIRNFPLYVFAVFIPFTYHLSSFFPSQQLNNRTMKQFVFCICLLLLFSWQLFYVLQTKPVGISTPSGATKAVDFMITKNLKGPIFNNFDIGSYLIYRLYPKEKVFVDGRPEAFPADFFQKTYIPMQQDPKRFAKEEKKYHFNTIFFAHTDQTPWAKQFLQDIIKNPTWQIVYLDDTVIILVKKPLITPIPPITPISLASFNPSSPSTQGLYQLFLFFQTIGLPEKQLEILQQIIEKDPDDCTALGILAQSQTLTASIYQARYATICK